MIRKRKKELQNLLQEKFDMPFMQELYLVKKFLKILPKKNLKISDIFEIHIVKIYSSQLGTYKGQKFTVKNTEIKKKDAFVYSSIDHQTSLLQILFGE